VRFVPGAEKALSVEAVGGGEDAEVVRLTTPARAGLALLLLGLTALFLAGTVVGQDDWWPFGPWRMFATSTAPSGSIYSLSIEVRRGDDASWVPAALTPTSVGLNRAEVEGRVPQMTRDPDMLGTLARSHARLRPYEPAWRAVRVVRTQVVLSRGTPTGEVRTSTVASWP
jgi:hypothetical protein